MIKIFSLTFVRDIWVQNNEKQHITLQMKQGRRHSTDALFS